MNEYYDDELDDEHDDYYSRAVIMTCPNGHHCSYDEKLLGKEGECPNSECGARFALELVPQSVRYYRLWDDAPPYYNDLPFGPEQDRFFTIWKQHWDNGIALEVSPHDRYLYLYSALLLRNEPSATRAEQMRRLADAYSADESEFAEHARECESDCHVLLGDYQRALDSCERRNDKWLSLKLLLGKHVVSLL